MAFDGNATVSAIKPALGRVDGRLAGGIEPFGSEHGCGGRCGDEFDQRGGGLRMRCAGANGGHIGGGELNFARQRSHQLGTRIRQNFAYLSQANLGLAIVFPSRVGSGHFPPPTFVVGGDRCYPETGRHGRELPLATFGHTEIVVAFLRAAIGTSRDLWGARAIVGVRGD